jgi:hypothetical protein
MKRKRTLDRNYDESEHYRRKKERSYKKTSRKKDRTVLKDVSKGRIDYDDYMEQMEDEF